MSETLPSQEETERLFWSIFESLPLHIRNKVKKWWGDRGDNIPYIFTNPDRFMGEVDYAATVGVTIMFRLEKIADRRNSFIKIIYHEVGHCYFVAIGRRKFIDYERKTERMEKEVIKWVKCRLDELKRNAAEISRLEQDSLISSLRTRFDFAPLWREKKSIPPTSL